MYRIKDHYLLLGIQDDIDLAGLDVKSEMLREWSEGGRVGVIVEAPSSLMDVKPQRLYEKPYSVFNFGNSLEAQID